MNLTTASKRHKVNTQSANMGTRQKTSKSAIERRRGAADAVALRLVGLTYRDIGARLGISVSSAYNRVKRELDRVNEKSSEDALALRRLEIERLDRMWARLWPRAFREAPGVYKAMDGLLSIMERRAKLLGLDAPACHEVSASGGSTLFPKQLDLAPMIARDPEYRRLQEELAMREAELMLSAMETK